MAKKKRKTGWIVALSVIAVVLLGGCIFVYAQWNNIQALSYAKQYTPEQREEMLKKNDAAVQEILNQVPEVQITPLSEEDEALLQSGQMSEEEALARIMGTSSAETEMQEENTGTIPEELPQDTTSDAAVQPEDTGTESLDQGTLEQPTETGGSAQTTEQTNSKSEDTLHLQELLARIYLLRSSFTGQLNSLVEQAKAEVIASGSKDNIFSIASKYIGMGNNLEAQCDAEMESLLNEIYAELKRTGGDTGMVEDIRTAYKNEKSITKAALIDKYY